MTGGRKMDEAVKIHEGHIAYASHTIDIQRPIVLEEEGRPVVVILPYAEYQRLVATREQTKADWRTRFRQLLAEMHVQTASFLPEEIEVDITAAFEEMRRERYSYAGGD
jgi:hypothetical protein